MTATHTPWRAGKRGIILIGAPGSGKGTQAKKIKDRLGYAHISTGDLLRAAVKEGTQLGREVKSFMDAAQFVPDAVVLRLVGLELASWTAQTVGFVLDGYPRTLFQAEALDQLVEVGQVIHIDVPFSLIEERVTGRRTSASGHVYHIKYNPPKVEGICDVTGEPLYQRSDDTPDRIKSRLATFEQETQPVIDYYALKGLLTRVNGVGTTDEVFKRVQCLL